MKDPIKKYEELQTLTEGIFGNLWRKINSPPSQTLPSSISANNANHIQSMFGVHYLIKGGPSNKYYDASDLIQLYINKQIKNDTRLKTIDIKTGKGSKFFPFINLMKREPFASKLKDYFVQSNNSPDSNSTYNFGIPQKPGRNGQPHYKTEKYTIPQMANFLAKNPAYKQVVTIYDSSKDSFVPLMQTKYWSSIDSLINFYATHP